jgi:biopolymer transport protein ExbD
VAGELPLTAMIDLFTILVIYLLMNFSATGDIFFLNKNLPLPRAQSTTPLKTAPLLSVVGDRFVLEAPDDYKGFTGITDNSVELTQLKSGLKQLLEIGNQASIPHSSRINIQAAQTTEMILIKRAMTVAVASGWTNVNFVVEKP